MIAGRTSLEHKRGATLLTGVAYFPHRPVKHWDHGPCTVARQPERTRLAEVRVRPDDVLICSTRDADLRVLVERISFGARLESVFPIASRAVPISDNPEPIARRTVLQCVGKRAGTIHAYCALF